MQGDVANFDAARGERIEQGRGEMQAGRGSGDRAGAFCVNRLITFAVGFVANFSRDIRRERNFSEEIQFVADIFRSGKSDEAMSLGINLRYFGDEGGGLLHGIEEADFCAEASAFSRSKHDPPLIGRNFLD